MILLGIILLILGYFTWRPLVMIGGVLVVIGLVLWLVSGSWYGFGHASAEEVTTWTTMYYS